MPKTKTTDTNKIVIVAAIILLVFFASQKNESTETANTIWFEVTEHYTDGTSYTYKPQATLPITIINPNTGKELSSYEFKLKAIITWTGTMRTYTFSGRVYAYMREAPSTMVLDTTALTQPSSLAEGQEFILYSDSISASTINNICTQVCSREQEVYLELRGTATATLTFEGNKVDSKTASATATIKLLYEAPGIDTFSITFG
ncbi:MAG: hypothetical protein QXR42_08025 [Candidatus Bathyarchaeia archaeon]